MKTRTVAGRTWHFTLAIGRVVGPEGFYHPTPIAGGLAGDVYVANMGGGDPRQRAHKIDHLTTDGEYIRAIGQGDFTWPEGLAVDQDGTLYCSDAYSHNGCRNRQTNAFLYTPPDHSTGNCDTISNNLA